jgi:hypothetical protein
MIRRLKIACPLETISFATGRRVEKELWRETGADMENEKQEATKEENRENKEKEVLTGIRNTRIEDIDHCSRENKSDCV